MMGRSKRLRATAPAEICGATLWPLQPSRVADALKHKCALVCISAVLLISTAPVSAQGTIEEREACTPDVFRLCSSFIPDPPAITACLQRRKVDLSNDCRKVIFPISRIDGSGSDPKFRDRVRDGQ